MKRLAYLDVLRGVAIVLMVIDHAYDWWLDEAAQATALGAAHRFLGTLAAPLFLALAGIGLALSVRRSEQSGQSRMRTVRHLALRGASLLLWGYALNLAVFYTGHNPADIWAVDVLHTIGLSVWLSIPLLWLPAPAALAAALLVAVLGQTAGHWVLPDWLAAYLTGTAGIGYFPLVLWLPYCYLGLAIGKWIAGGQRPGRLMAVLAAAGALMLPVMQIIPTAWGYRHPRPVFIPFSLAVLFGLLGGLWWWSGRWRQSDPIGNTLRDMGEASLMLYAFHHLVGYRLFWLLGLVRGRSWRGEYGALGPLEATALLVALLGLMWLAARLWNRWHRVLRKPKGS